MKSFTDYLWFETKKKIEIVHITPLVQDILNKSRIEEGLCLVSAMHITASIFVNDLESGLHDDILKWIDQLAPHDSQYKHHQTGEDNGEAHLKRILCGHQCVIPITKGALDLGPWEQLFYGEWDGNRRKRVVVKILGE